MSRALDRLGAAAPSREERELLRAALLPRQEAIEAWLWWRDVHEVDTASFRAHEILPAVSASVPDEVLEGDAARLKGLRRRTWAANRLTLASLAHALDTLAGHGLEPILVVKGARLVDDVYSQPGTRRMADADVVVGPRDFDESLSALLASGWEATGIWTHAADLVDADGQGLDLHRWVLFPRFVRVEETGCYERTEPGTLLGRPVRRLALADELVLAVVHGLFTPGHSAVRWPLDVAQIMSHQASASSDLDHFWDRVVSSCAELGVGPIVADGLGFCSEELGLEVPTVATQRMRSRSLDPLLGLQWWHRKAGRFPPMRLRKFIDLERAGGRAPTVTGYVTSRWEALQQHGPRRVIRARARGLSRRAERLRRLPTLVGQGGQRGGKAKG